MALTTYTVKSGDTLWKICGMSSIAPSIAGSTRNAKIETLIKLNNIKKNSKGNPLIYKGQVLKLAGSTGSAATKKASTTLTTQPQKCLIDAVGLQAEDTTGRALLALWSWSKTNTANYKYRWLQWIPQNGKWTLGSEGTTSSYEAIYCFSEWTADEQATKVRFEVLPIAKNKSNNKPYWKEGTGKNDVAWASKEYDFANNPPLPLEDAPELELDTEETPVPSTSSILIMSYKAFDARKLNAKYVRFQLVANDNTIFHTSPNIDIILGEPGDELDHVSYQHSVMNGDSYQVRACTVGANGKVSTWSELSSAVGTKPVPTSFSSHRVSKRTDGTISVFLQWNGVRNATNYIIEYVADIRDDFDNAPSNVQKVQTEDNRTSIEITNLEAGHRYFFRIRTVNKKVSDEPSIPSIVIEIPLGEPPAAPTTWSSSNSAFAGEPMELNWTHNTRDGSAQSHAELSLKIGDAGWESHVFANTTTTQSGELNSNGNFTLTPEVLGDATSENVNSNELLSGISTGTGEPVYMHVSPTGLYEYYTVVQNQVRRVSNAHVQSFAYGQSISYKGELHVVLDTDHPSLKNSKIQWKVRTAGVTDAFSDTDWSVERTIYIYEKPTLALSVTSDLAGSSRLDTLTTFPFYIRGRVSLESYEVQRPLGYYLRMVSNDFYQTVDDAGRNNTINAGDVVYSKYFDVANPSNPDLIVEMSADNINLEPTVSYTVICDADMSTGLSVTQSHPFVVDWTDAAYVIDAIINVDSDSYTASIIPSCRELVAVTDENGNAIYDDDGYAVVVEGEAPEDIRLAVYRREYNGTLTEIARNVRNNGMGVVDPHPALDYARYRVVAKDTSSGAISYYDVPGEKVGCTSVIIQWDEAWAPFDVSDENPIEHPSGSGSTLVLPYNVKISDNRKREVSKVTYAGREYAVSYHGIHIEEGSSWSTVIPKDDTETIYALRRLSMWNGPVYIREPSGMGFWAIVVPTFNIDHDALTIPVTLDVSRVEGGA